MIAWGQTVTYVTTRINPLFCAVVRGGDGGRCGRGRCGGGGCCCYAVIVLRLGLVFFLRSGRPVRCGPARRCLVCVVTS